MSECSAPVPCDSFGSEAAVIVINGSEVVVSTVESVLDAVTSDT